MDRRIPTAAKLMISDEPPALMNGSVMPVTGSKATTTAMFTKAWKPRLAVIPAAKRPPNVSGAVSETRTPSYTRRAKSAITISPPINPNSSPMMAKMKSFDALGRYRLAAWWLAPRPVPVIPPRARASSPCTA